MLWRHNHYDVMYGSNQHSEKLHVKMVVVPIAMIVVPIANHTMACC